MKRFTYESQSEHETFTIAEKLAKLLNPGNVLTLEGELGTGKTVFTKGIAKGLEVEDVITSPTFTIVKEYKGKYPLYHMDVYRLENSDEDIGFLEYFEGDGISIIEWAQFIEMYLPEERLNITIEFLDFERRKITFEPYGNDYERIVEKLRSQL